MSDVAIYHEKPTLVERAGIIGPNGPIFLNRYHINLLSDGVY